MRIGITCYPVYGGSGVVATELGRALATRGHEIHFIAYSLPFRLSEVTENIYFHEVSVNRYPLFDFPPYALSLTSKMVDVAKYEALDLLHVHYAIPHATSAVLARDILEKESRSLPVVTTLHGTDITIVGQDASYSPVVNYSINASDGVTAVSNFLRQETYDAFDIEVPIKVIPNFIDTEHFRRLEKEHFRSAICAPGQKVVVHVSNFRRVKNVSHVVEVFHRILQEGISAKLLLVGDGPDRSNVEQLTRDLGIQRAVRFLGKQDPVQEILSIADLFLLTSGSESFGLAPLEAMACGVPVVCSDVGGLPELVEGSEAGFLCPLGDIQAFAKACIKVLTDDSLHAEMAQHAREYAVRHYDTHSIVAQYEEYYEEIIARTAAQNPKIIVPE
ncbi:MAG: N-acetyl-alpha-D-glucosaminyl L-malate synthase BshA [Rhodothermaceae bacterium]|nr:N-acetyl-alpha-D-glucosaminyl L-malate synthase BshA [Bacteroidota bacterium]MXX96441.1 N-acetyl-alpha-D-glucosaminyl L-malate synthase BshA [Rhodothermaceae bacterium]MXZ59113.1 N-acetyl-alpha-D-glucosaminyl L-malate synthase BshA [Rhodothermaceae bacterium]MYB90308.1 N-acetyl-alpha-D-glucosaminyl L-malate synthase BshA [Rhodothermaceae bacterium]MYD68516.1 N-acetyl-alpha-D-glucosaminyl L-malate synthase BshA [Rhodothermaceae bacterium]